MFDRSKRKVFLTDAGEVFYKHALNLNEVYKNTLADLDEYKTNATSLSIAAISVIAQCRITSYIAQFKSVYPNIKFTLEEREASAILPALKSRQYDLAFVRDNYMDLSQYSSLEVSRDKLLVAVSGKHKHAKRKSISLAELSDENFIMFDKGTIVHELSVDVCREAGFEPRVFYASLRVESIISMVASNAGVALIMGKILDYHKQPDVIAIPLDKTVKSNVVLIYLKNQKIPKSATTFLGFIKKMLADNA